MIKVSIREVLADPQSFFGQELELCGSASFIYRSRIWVHDDPEVAEPVSGRIVVSPNDKNEFSHLIPYFTGTTSTEPMRSRCRLLTVAGTLLPTQVEGFVASIQGMLWSEQHYSAGDAEGLGAWRESDYSERCSGRSTHPGLTPGLSVAEAMSRRCELDGKEVSVNGVLLARRDGSVDRPSLLMDGIEDRSSNRCIAVALAAINGWAARLPIIPGLSISELHPDKVVRAIMRGRLNIAPGTSGVSLSQITEVCLTTSREPTPSCYTCYRP